ncbi:MAG: 30S ribosomal protein S11 [Bacilli bacterium]
MAYKARKVNKKTKKANPIGKVYIHSTYNNTIVTVSDQEGNVITWASSGTIGYKGSKKKTPFAAGRASEVACAKAFDMGVKQVDVFVKGVAPGRESAIRSIATAGIEVLSITDVTPIPHNGCRPPKKPRG